MLLLWQKDKLFIRVVERRLAWASEDMLIAGPVFLIIGQEAVPVAKKESLLETDLVFGAHRSVKQTGRCVFFQKSWHRNWNAWIQ